MQYLFMRLVFFMFVNGAQAASGAHLGALAKDTVEVIVSLTVMMAVMGIYVGAIKLRKGMESEGKPVIIGACICLFIASSLYMIVSFIWK
mgnify:CR=1 FL=1